MLTDREILKSIVDRLEELFENPPSGFTNSFNVYFEDSFSNPLFEPTLPYVWLLDKNVRPTKTRIPCLIVKYGPSGWLPFELGNREGQFVSASIIVFGKSRGEVMDFLSFLKKHIEPLTLYSYGETREEKYKVGLNNLSTWIEDAGGETGMEGTMSNMGFIVFDFTTKEL